MKVSKGMLAIVSGPSGVGKSTIIAGLLRDERFALSVSATTREPRPEEIPGVNYHYISREEFLRRVASGDFLEHAVVHGHDLYGTLNDEVDRLVDAGRIVLLDIDVQGAALIGDRENTTSIFIAPPDFAALEQRLSGRGTEADEVRRKRLETARIELGEQNKYHHVVVNDDVDKTVEKMKCILLDEADNRATSH